MPTIYELIPLSPLRPNSNLTPLIFSPISDNLPRLTPIMKNILTQFFFSRLKNTNIFFVFSIENQKNIVQPAHRLGGMLVEVIYYTNPDRTICQNYPESVKPSSFPSGIYGLPAPGVGEAAFQLATSLPYSAGTLRVSDLPPPSASLGQRSTPPGQSSGCEPSL